MSDVRRPTDAELRDINATRADSVAPPGIVENLPYTPRPTFHAEEGQSDRSDWWSLVKAVLIIGVVVVVLGLLLAL